MDLTKLCSLALEKTIADPDKYQFGLTKIFFRAGMLAALESMRSERLNAMVTVVQKNMRRRMAMKNYQRLRSATIKIQTWWRGILARKLVDQIRKDVCARRLQALFRTSIQRTFFLNTRRSVVAFQSSTSELIAAVHLTNNLFPQGCAVLKLARNSGTLAGMTPLPSSRASFAESQSSLSTQRWSFSDIFVGAFVRCTRRT